MTLLFTIRTANRAPKTNYLGHTVASLIRGGMPAADIHLVSTDPAVDWMGPVLASVPSVHTPEKPRSPNANGLAQIDLLEQYQADWIVMSEDDLEWCADPIGSLTRWLELHANSDHLVYRFFCFGPMQPLNKDVAATPLREQRGSQVVAMRAEDAQRFAAWARKNPLHWRPFGAPFQNRPNDGFDKLIGYWALQDRPKVTTGLVSRPFFVRHLGKESAIHSHGITRDREWGGREWSYRRPAV